MDEILKSVLSNIRFIFTICEGFGKIVDETVGKYSSGNMGEALERVAENKLWIWRSWPCETMAFKVPSDSVSHEEPRLSCYSRCNSTPGQCHKKSVLERRYLYLNPSLTPLLSVKATAVVIWSVPVATKATILQTSRKASLSLSAKTIMQNCTTIVVAFPKRPSTTMTTWQAQLPRWGKDSMDSWDHKCSIVPALSVSLPFSPRSLIRLRCTRP